jgi:hypothetical protein
MGTPAPDAAAPTGSGGTAGGTAGAGGGSAGAGGAGGSGGGGMGGRGGASAPDASMTQPPPMGTPDAGVVMEIPPPPPRRAGYTIFHSTNVSVWESQDPNVYMQYKAGFDEIISILERGYFAIQARLGTGVKLPLRVIIPQGGCCGGFAGGGDVGYNDGDFKDAGGLQWTRGVVIGEVVNNVTGAVSNDWPRDWWADTAWYFPGFVAVDVMKDVVPAYWMKWETEEKYPTYPVYVLYKALLAEQGWPVYQRLFDLIKTDKINWGKIGTNPSPVKTNFVIAYISTAANANLGSRFVTAKVNGADPDAIQAIMDARKKLVDATAAGKNTTAGWAAFRMGDYANAVTGL